MIIADTPEYIHTRYDFYGDKDGERVLLGYQLTRWNKIHSYGQVEIHAYCRYRTKNGFEHATFCKLWTDTDGNMEEFLWNEEENRVNTYNSYASFYLDGVRYYSKKSYEDAVNAKRS